IALRGRGLVGVIGPHSTPEDITYMINRASFFSDSIRRKPRAPVNIPVTVRSGARTVKTAASQLSRDGMFIVTLNPPVAGAELDIEFRLPGGDKDFRTKAKALYCIEINKELNIISSPNDPFKRLVTHPGMAVFFMDLPDEEREAIDRYIGMI
ncbi:MAG: PilZ domain-containing protein, partial [Deltaproteobacteria bacterium]|nr:PilZ domain-containing protein [Deltaproteobacteria bacterium]